MTERWQAAKLNAWPEPASGFKAANPPARKRQHPVHFLALDTETTTDVYQNLMFGTFVLGSVDPEFGMHVYQEGIFYHDLLPRTDPAGFTTLREYVDKGQRRRQSPDPFPGAVPKLTGNGYYRYDGPVEPYSSWVDANDVHEAMETWPTCYHPPSEEIWFGPVSAFVTDILYEVAFPSKLWDGPAIKPATIVGANLPFDLPRVARDARPGRGRFQGGVSLRMLPTRQELQDAGIEVDRAAWLDDVWRNQRGYRLQMVRRGAKGMKFGFTGIGAGYRAYFTDILNLGFVLTNKTWTLAVIAEAFAARWKKMPDPGYGTITEDMITYARADVFATADAYCGLVKEASQHTTSFDETVAHSPASLAKAYFAAMGFPPPLARQPDFPRWALGASRTAFLGARTEARIRRPDAPLPVTVLDFTSEYATNNINMRMMDLLRYERTEVRDETDQVQELLDTITLDDLFDRDRWPELRGMARLCPDHDLLSVRTPLGGTASTIALATVTSSESLWYPIPDLVVSKLLTGKPPRIIEGHRFYPAGRPLPLRPVGLRGEVRVEPAAEDFYRVSIEQRLKRKATVKGHPSSCACPDCCLANVLKCMTNVGAYGMFAEFNPTPIKRQEIRVHGTGRQPITVAAESIDVPGAYCFPPIAMLVTAAARLMLAMVEKAWTDMGGAWAFGDTDSLALVAAKERGTVHSSGGDIPVLSYDDMERLRARFNSLSPYDPDRAGGPVEILKWERYQTSEYNGDARQIYAYPVSSKWYALYRLDKDGRIEIVPEEGRKEHGLGAFMNPHNPAEIMEKGKRQYVTEIWEWIISRALSRRIHGRPDGWEPSFLDRPVMRKLPITTWHAYRLLDRFNAGRPWDRRIKPGGFVMSPVIASGFDRTRPTRVSRKDTKIAADATGSDAATKITLITPWNPDSSQWLGANYVDTDGQDDMVYRITTAKPAPRTGSSADPIRVMTWRDFIQHRASHPEVKFCDSAGETCSRKTVGFLRRHNMRITRIQYVTKEASWLSEAEELIANPADIGAGELGTGRDEIRELVLPVLAAHGIRGHKSIADALHRPRRQFAAYLRRRDLTNNLSATLWRNRADPMIKLALRLAYDDMAADMPAEWSDPAYTNQEWRSVLAAWNHGHIR